MQLSQKKDVKGVFTKRLDNNLAMVSGVKKTHRTINEQIDNYLVFFNWYCNRWTTDHYLWHILFLSSFSIDDKKRGKGLVESVPAWKKMRNGISFWNYLIRHRKNIWRKGPVEVQIFSDRYTNWRRIETLIFFFYYVSGC